MPLQAIKDAGEQVEGNAAATVFSFDPQVFQIAGVSRGIRVNGDTQEAGWPASEEADDPFAPVKLKPPLVLRIGLLLLVRAEKCVWRVA